MLHDQQCERVTSYEGLCCKCASRAYDADPLPDDYTPIYTERKTPNQEGG